MKSIRLVLGDQLNIRHSWFKQPDKGIVYVMMEVRSETDYVLHHAQKLIGFFGAMRTFSEELKSRGHRVHYIKINDPENLQSFSKNLDFLIQLYNPEIFEFIEPDEYRVDQELKTWGFQQKIQINCVGSEHFLTDRDTLRKIVNGKRNFRMENFYRIIRRKFNIMLDENGEPWSGRWNFDEENRKFFKGNLSVPKVWEAQNDLSEVWQDIQACGCSWFGYPKFNPFPYPINREQALAQLNHFIQFGLPKFGEYQDSMNVEHPVLWHSRLSFALNLKFLHPLEVVNASILAYQQRSQEISLAQLEGFVRQIIGWREYMRGIYWAYMPDFEKMNFFGHNNTLPTWYWDGNTCMNCLKTCIKASLQQAYAHHIQRLMVTGAFALMAGVDPKEVDHWYLGIYMDAIQWVQIANTRGMSQFADGGLTATKPYLCSASYIKRMSNYCKACFYNPEEKFSERACPWNTLYWNFFIKHQDKLSKHPRLSLIYKHLDNMLPEEKDKIIQKAEILIFNLNKL